MSQQEMTTASVFAGAVGSLTILGALGAGYWWAAHHMAWWTFALAFAGLAFGLAFIKAIVRDLRKSGGR